MALPLEERTGQSCYKGTLENKILVWSLRRIKELYSYNTSAKGGECSAKLFLIFISVCIIRFALSFAY